MMAKRKTKPKTPPRRPGNPIDRLCELVPPPVNPVYHQGDWEAVESQLGLALPADYKLLIERYGRGSFGGASMTSGLYITSYLIPCDPRSIASGGILVSRQVLILG